MTISSSTIKSIAKEILKGNYVSSFIVCLSVLSVMFVCNNIAAVIYTVAGYLAMIVSLILLSFLLIAPLCLGGIRYFWRLACQVKDNPVTVFYYFSSLKLYFKVLSLLFGLATRIGLTLLVFLIPVFAVEILAGSWIYSILNISTPIWTVNLTEVIDFLVVLALASTFFACLKFYLAPALFVGDEDMAVSECIRLSAVISKRTTLDFVFLIFSFSGWILLSLLIIPLVFTLPFMATAYLVHSTEAITDYNKQIFKNSMNQIPTYIAGV